jgi:ABC-2 type transport system permease protein
MRSFWLIARHEYRKMVRTRSFLISTLALPVVFLLIMGVSALTAISSSSRLPIGYVDQAGLIRPFDYTPSGSGPEIVAFATPEAAETALRQGEIQAFYLIPADYRERPVLGLVYGETRPDSRGQRSFNAFVRASLVSDLPDEVQQRLLNGSTGVVRAVDSNREMDSGNWLAFVLPFVSGPLLMIAIISSAGYLLQVVTDEKENRTVEIMVTSLSPGQLISGKTVGLMGVALTQLGIWALALTVTLLVANRFYDLLTGIAMPWEILLLIGFFFLPTYALAAGMMTAVGGIAGEVKQGQQIAGLLNLLFLFPFFLTALILVNPNSSMMVFMTLFPTTAFVTLTMRWGMTIVPWEQVIAAWLILVAAAVFAIWASGRIFRAGMLHYGQGLNLRAALRALWA